MPTYVYECAKCGDEFEVWQSIKDDPLTRHTGSCRGKLSKVIQPAGIVLKGSGFYKNDSRNGGGKRPTGGDAAKTDTAKTDTAKQESPAKSQNGSGDSKSPTSKTDAKHSTPAAKST